MTQLPRGFRWRRPTLDDAEAILELVARRNTALVGFADFTLDEVRDAFNEHGFDPNVDAWLIQSDDIVVGYGWVFGKGDTGMADVDVFADDDAVADWLWDQVLLRSAEIGAKSGHDHVTVDIGIYQTDAIQQSRASSRGLN